MKIFTENLMALSLVKKNRNADTVLNKFKKELKRITYKK